MHRLVARRFGLPWDADQKLGQQTLKRAYPFLPSTKVCDTTRPVPGVGESPNRTGSPLQKN